MRKPPADIIELIAVNPGGDLACDFTIANKDARAGLGEALERGMLGPAIPIAGGVEAHFRSEAWDDVQRYVTLESQCCSFLTLHAERSEDHVLLRVTGRAEAEPFIRALFGLDREDAR